MVSVRNVIFLCLAIKWSHCSITGPHTPEARVVILPQCAITGHSILTILTGTVRLESEGRIIDR